MPCYGCRPSYTIISKLFCKISLRGGGRKLPWNHVVRVGHRLRSVVKGDRRPIYFRHLKRGFRSLCSVNVCTRLYGYYRSLSPRPLPFFWSGLVASGWRAAYKRILIESVIFHRTYIVPGTPPRTRYNARSPHRY